MLDQQYKYARPSALRASTLQGGTALHLAAETGDAPGAGTYLDARVLHPETTAKALRSISEIVGARFYVPPAMLARILREADPVATVGAESVRFEGFSACCSAYIRLDLDPNALDTSRRSKGTTNVDFGPELRGALSAVRRDSTLELKIGAESVEVVKDGQGVLEKRVPLPLRWLKGFAEVQRAMSEMDLAVELPRIGAQRLLRDLPRGKTDHQIWVAAQGQTARLGAREVPGAVQLRGGHRLRVLETLVPLSSKLKVHANRRTGASSWCLEFGAQRLWLVLNAEPWRGFSGDGGLLDHLAHAEVGVPAVRAHLNWQDNVDATSLAEATGLARAEIDTALARLASAGQLGYDLHRGAYFHRVLPFDMDRIETLNPRLKAAQKLVSLNAVRPRGDSFEVHSDGVIHTVRAREDGWSCTCPWFAKNGRQRGPCKHILAVEIETGP